MTETPIKSVTPAPKVSSVAPGGNGGDVRSRLRFLSPLSGVVVLAVDNALFGANAGTAMVATPVVSLLAFCVTSASVFSIQRFRERDSGFKGLVKGVLCGLLAGIPTSIAGTALGGLVILASGLDRILKRNNGHLAGALRPGSRDSESSS